MKQTHLVGADYFHTDRWTVWHDKTDSCFSQLPR